MLWNVKESVDEGQNDPSSVDFTGPKGQKWAHCAMGISCPKGIEFAACGAALRVVGEACETGPAGLVRALLRAFSAFRQRTYWSEARTLLTYVRQPGGSGQAEEGLPTGRDFGIAVVQTRRGNT